MNDQIARPKFVTDLLAEVDGFDEGMFPPPAQMKEGERVLAVASPWTRKLFSLMRHYNRELKRLKVEIEFDSSPAGSIDCRLCEMKYKYDVLYELLWAVARAEAGPEAWHLESVGLRQDWKIVQSNQTAEARFKDFLGGIIGGSFSPE